jgi:NAD(P)-dependent dehydrogenase (short-subunit alcohol dehydrogenase family)
MERQPACPSAPAGGQLYWDLSRREPRWATRGRLAGKVALVTGGSRGIGAEIVRRLVAVDARGPFLMMQAVAGMLAGGGRVVNISSGVTSTALAGIALYSGAKAFLDQVTRVAAAEFAARRITVNAVGPGRGPSALPGWVICGQSWSLRHDDVRRGVPTWLGRRS